MFIPVFQINDKYVERRILVSEACGALSPYLSVSVKEDNKHEKENKYKIYLHFVCIKIGIILNSSV